MKKILTFFAVSASFLWLHSQTISSSKWTDLFSYNDVLAIKEDNGRLIAATKNGIFFYNIASGEISKLSKTNGLHEVKISAFDYNSETQTGLVGYENGSMDVISPAGITLIIDIPIATGFSGSKRINHISINGNQAVVSVGYGVSIFNLERKEFGDTAFFNTSTGFISAKESIIKDNKVYSVTESGLWSHEINVSFPIFSNWTRILNGNFTQIAAGDKIVAGNSTDLRIGDGNTFSSFSGGFSSVKDVVIKDGQIIVADQNSLKVYNSSGTPVRQKDFGEALNTGLTAGSQLYGGTSSSGLRNESGTSLKPDGPYSNTSYKIDINKNQIVISSGNRSSYNNPVVSNLGYYHFDGTSWNYPQFFLSGSMSFNVLDAVINPAKPTEIFFVNYVFNDNSGGIFKMNNNEFVKGYITNEGSRYRVSGLVFDEKNQLFVAGMIMGAQEPYKIGYYYYNASNDSFSKNEVLIAGGTQKPYTKDGILYIPAPYISGGGMLIYDYNNTPASAGDDSSVILRKDNNLPIDGVVSAAIDRNDNLWIGTRLGLRILSDPKGAITQESPQTEPIIIEENGLGEELFRDNAVLQIAVDSGNQKWVSIDGGGVFYLSDSGEQTLLHFTKENSPLPTNSITDIKVDESNGKVYFVSLDGVVVYQGDVVNANENFGDVLVYPNPVVYANYKGNVKIRGLAQKTNIRITDAAGNLVHQAVARGGFYEWNLNNQRGVRVASGIYFVLMTNEDGTDTATAKIAVVN